MATYEIIRENTRRSNLFGNDPRRSALVDHPHCGGVLHRGNLP